MLLLSIDLVLGAALAPSPFHLGGSLKGFFEGAIKENAPHLLPVLRPRGDNERANFTLHAPPPGSADNPDLRFGLVLFNELERAVPQVVRALSAQCASRLNGRTLTLQTVTAMRPGEPPWSVVESGRLKDDAFDRAASALEPDFAGPAGMMGHSGPSAVHRLDFQSPLLLVSRGALRSAMRHERDLPWPSLGQVLDSIAQALTDLEPGLARAMGLGHGWHASAASHQSLPLTPAANPAQQLSWLYRSTPRSVAQAGTRAATRRVLDVPGILGTLIYLSTGDHIEAELLQWGQWCGVGQKTTMGFGSYTLSEPLAPFNVEDGSPF